MAPYEIAIALLSVLTMIAAVGASRKWSGVDFAIGLTLFLAPSVTVWIGIRFGNSGTEPDLREVLASVVGWILITQIASLILLYCRRLRGQYGSALSLAALIALTAAYVVSTFLLFAVTSINLTMYPKTPKQKLAYAGLSICSSARIEEVDRLPAGVVAFRASVRLPPQCEASVLKQLSKLTNGVCISDRLRTEGCSFPTKPDFFGAPYGPTTVAIHRSTEGYDILITGARPL